MTWCSASLFCRLILCYGLFWSSSWVHRWWIPAQSVHRLWCSTTKSVSYFYLIWISCIQFQEENPRWSVLGHGKSSCLLVKSLILLVSLVDSLCIIYFQDSPDPRRSPVGGSMVARVPNCMGAHSRTGATHTWLSWSYGWYVLLVLNI